ncbi:MULTISPECIES: DUF1493 family protein [unclassified Pantoea]|uniref:DUF1493 family protein n=1 Tax=unclassified Pantoea TaxID=2630326 RepID=UPI0024777473|nr:MULTISPECIES: DUF1493 family protein [unclassified Pantoea]GME47291.1 DUF1493 family protein [Pantoea sp. QMID3]GME47415.1 DUF1493 family protein [Pantoea sp. QMID1]GME62244.1 DUF1493 family protein [Pantoea sp. QMID4]GME63567.1 DUF1493 family protein [Pantoea sp. QMID2]
MVDDTQARVMALIEPWNGRSLLTFRRKTLTPEMSLNLDMKLDPEDAAECLQNVFDAFAMDSDQVTFSLYYPKNPREAIPLTIGMLVEAVRTGHWCYD